MTIAPRVFARSALHAGRTWWPSAATWAFLASGLEVLSLALFLWQRSQAAGAGGSKPPLGRAVLAIAELMLAFVVWIFLLRVAVEVTALWGAGRRQGAVAPVTARLGQWAVTAYVVLSAPVFVLTVRSLMNLGGFGVLPEVSAPAAQPLVPVTLIFRFALLPLIVAIVYLGMASRHDAGTRQPWPSGFMLLTALLGVCNVDSTLFALPVASQSLWQGSLDFVLGAGMWAAIGASLRAGYLLAELMKKVKP
jgi:hypothetical protein